MAGLWVVIHPIHSLSGNGFRALLPGLAIAARVLYGHGPHTGPSVLATDHRRLHHDVFLFLGESSWKSATLLDGLAIDDGRAEGTGGGVVEAVQLEPVDEEEPRYRVVWPVEAPSASPSRSNARMGLPLWIISRSPCRVTSKNPIVIQTAYWCVRTVVRFMAFWSISVRK